MLNQCYVVKDGIIAEVPLNEWASYRANGYEFSDLASFIAQEAEDIAEEVEAELEDEDEDVAEGAVEDGVNIDNTKKEILQYAKDNGIDLDTAQSKEDLLWCIAKELDQSPEDYGVGT